MTSRVSPASQSGFLFGTLPLTVPPRPFLKWAGGKRQLLPALRELVPRDYGTYYEPFAGGAALFFDLLPKRAVLCDLNDRLIRTYRGVASNVEQVIGLLSRWPHDRGFFLSLRKSDTSLKTDAEIAAWFIYLNRTAFNGLYRVNRQNEFNVPFGRYSNPTICDAEGLRQASVVLRSCAEIRTCDFEEAVKHAKRGDFVYFDPPYVPLSAYSDFARYTADSFGATEQRRLRDIALELKGRGVQVMLSNSSTPLVHELYRSDFQIHLVNARRAVSCRGQGRGPVAEVVIT